MSRTFLSHWFTTHGQVTELVTEASTDITSREEERVLDFYALWILLGACPLLLQRNLSAKLGPYNRLLLKVCPVLVLRLLIQKTIIIASDLS